MSQSYNLRIYSTSYVTWTKRNGGCTKIILNSVQE